MILVLTLKDFENPSGLIFGNAYHHHNSPSQIYSKYHFCCKIQTVEIQIGAAKINKYASSESRDALEVVERPSGGLSIVLADGQRSGKSAKRISNMVIRKVVSLLAEGVRDGAAARAASDYLYAERGGKVLSTLNIISIDLQSKTLVISRNNPAPMVVIHAGNIQILEQESQPVGVYRNTRPAIDQLPLEENLTVIAFSDGLVHAGDRIG
ncbi:MAG: SpoIIE family protein phosphatase [Chloroflexi bacterium]|nr:SpoIIE family protein phosphatase [Chloroflexota bacterium]